tara:strand:- start:246 stop:1175 length:930 start_codon:yes stop_codon:yes gene_type:complete
MTFSDWTRIILVLLIFALLHGFIILAVQYKNIKKNWPKWKCNPMVMPFAGVFGHDEFENFTQCIQTMQSDYMKYLLQPVNMDLSIIGEMGTAFTAGMAGGFDLITQIRSIMSNIFKAIYGAFYQLIVQIQLMFINIKDVFGKIAAIVSIFSKIILGLHDFMMSMKNGPPGQAINLFCFDPDTLIMTDSGKLIPMKDIELNTKLKNGSKVLSVMTISNLDSDGNIINEMYEITDGEINELIYVTGSHLIYDPSLKDYVNVKELNVGNKCKISNKETRELSCLITSDHTIPIGEWVFHDWEDNVGSPSKNL